MTIKPRLPEHEWSHAIGADDIPTQGKTYRISPNELQRQAIARRLDILTLDALTAVVQVSRDGHVVHVSGEFSADLTQACVVSLEPLSDRITDTFEAWYADTEQVLSFRRAQHEAMTKNELADLPMLEEHEDPEPIENGRIDLGELVTQYLSLSVNPYPQKEGINYENKGQLHTPAAQGQLRPNPFAALKNWRPKD